ncbi:MAG: glutamate formimidoyltransferase, partial [Bacteroidia bacterium]|nr:glutamate formimidoyltransferase [Bacteroidia bacterium]MDW8335171.1 glutamate formimidoyltransferase [Bacteroidia bacterium]
MEKILACAMNVSEGRDEATIAQIEGAIASVPGVYVLHVDVGKTANRTVVTFAGAPEAVVESAFLAFQAAAQWIDMRKHTGAHPRIGAVDVCPLIPIRGVEIAEAVALAHRLAKRVGDELGIPVYLYEYAATHPERKKLANIRNGEYEGFARKIYLPEWAPDYGPRAFNPVSGQSVIGVRDVLIAYNVNLHTKDVEIARAIAAQVRESGRPVKKNGAVVFGPDGKPLREGGMLMHTAAIGWYIEEYGICQVSMNLTKVEITPIHVAYDTVRLLARRHSVEVGGSEIVGLVTLEPMLESGRYARRLNNLPPTDDESELIRNAVDYL